MKDIRTLCEEWSKQTYRDGLNAIVSKDTELYKQAISIFTELKIIDIPMNGFSCENLPKTHEQGTAIKKTYSEIFHEEFEKKTFTPASYMLQLLIESNKSTKEKNKIIGSLARGLRTLTSLLREPDFAYHLQSKLMIFDTDVKTHLNSKQDSSDHTDVLLNYKKNEYRIWLYQFSPRGLPHDIERLTGKRGKLPIGTHIICPLHTEVAIKYVALCKRLSKNKLKLNSYKKELLKCSERAIKKRENIESKIQKTDTTITDLENQIEREQKLCLQELDVVCGWFFYSEQYIGRTVNFINSLSPVKYQDVVDILSAPERFVGNLQSFTKGE